MTIVEQFKYQMYVKSQISTSCTKTLNTSIPNTAVSVNPFNLRKGNPLNRITYVLV